VTPLSIRITFTFAMGDELFTAISASLSILSWA
jgi:hypothetical protein